MTKRNLCDTCLHRTVCRHGIAQQWGRMAHCAYYERLLEIGYTLGREPASEATRIVRLYARLETPPEEDET